MATPFVSAALTTQTTNMGISRAEGSMEATAGANTTAYIHLDESLAHMNNRNNNNRDSNEQHLPALTNTLPISAIIDPQIYSSPHDAYYTTLMRRSIHKLIASTTRFDRITTGALALLSDVARLYLMRIGEACRCRGDLANRTRLNIFDIADATTSELGVDWESVKEWTETWHSEAGTTLTVTEPSDDTKHAGIKENDDGDKENEEEEDRLIQDIREDEFSKILEDLVLNDTKILESDFDGIAPPHFPTQQIGNAHDEAKTDDDEQTAEVIDSSHSDGDTTEKDDESPEALTASLIHLTSSSLTALHPSIEKDKSLMAFFKPASKFDLSCAPDEVLPDFDIPTTPPPSADSPKSIKPGCLMLLQGDSTKADLLGECSHKWREARYKAFPEIWNNAAAIAEGEMENAPLPVRRVRRTESHPDPVLEIINEGDEEDKDPTDSSVPGAAYGAPSKQDMFGGDENAPGTSFEMDIDVDIDVGGPDRKHSDNGETDKTSNNGKIQECVDDSVVPEVIHLPPSSGLRGTDIPHWASKWFTEPMRARLCVQTSQDVAPFDSLFIGEPGAGRRQVVDEVARAFVDSEGGGHLHEKTPLDGFGTNANGQSLPNSSGSALRWTLHHLMQAKGTGTVDSLYTGRSSLAGGISGDGVAQYVNRVSLLIKPSAEESAMGSVSGSDILHELPLQLIAGAEKRVPWTQNKLDIHKVETQVAGNAVKT